MEHGLETLLEYSKPYLGNSLVSIEQLGSIETLCSGLPAIFHNCYLELRETEERVDFIAMAQKWNVQKFLNTTTTSAIEKSRILKAWTAQIHLPMVSYEYDMIVGQPVNPMLMWTLDDGYITHRKKATTKTDILDKIDRCFRLEQVTFDRNTITELNNFVTALKVPIRLLHFVNLRQRGLEAFRIVIGCQVSTCFEVLEILNLDFSLLAFKKLLNILQKYPLGVSLQLTFPRLERRSFGVEVYFSNPQAFEQNKVRLVQFFTELEQAQLLSSHKTKALISWLGKTVITDEITPYKLEILRDLTIKFVFHRDQPIEVKFYLGINATYKLF